MEGLLRHGLLFCFVGLMYATCLNDCTGHGQCGGDDTCVCEPPWTGTDCSIFDMYLNSGESAEEQEVVQKQWKFYRHSVQASGVDLVWWLNESTVIGECDLYLQLNDYPNKAFYTQRNVNTFQNSQLIEKNAQPGLHYAGVYGFSGCTFSISVSESGCIEGCVHGTCMSSGCQCDPGYIGDTCDTKYFPLDFGEPLDGQVIEGGWDYYYIEVNQGDHLVFKVEDNVGDCDIYVAYDKLPTLWKFDIANVTVKDLSTIEFAGATAGTYVLGVYGFSESTYTATVNRVIDEELCPSRCSGHGNCVDEGECDCRGGYEGVYCEWRDAPLVLSTLEVGFVGVGVWNYYNIRVITQNALVIQLVEEGEEGDCDLYVRENDKPSLSSFDYIDLKTANDVKLVIQQPGNEIWYIGVRGYASCSYSLIVTEEVVCNCGLDNPHGECAEDGETCLCEEGWSGVDCSVLLKELTSGVVLEGEGVGRYNWKYYKFEVTESSTGVVSLRENGTKGLLWLYVSFTDEPSLWNYDLIDNAVDTTYHEISVVVPNPQTRTLYVGVYGNPFGIHGESLSYDLVAWASPF